MHRGQRSLPWRAAARIRRTGSALWHRLGRLPGIRAWRGRQLRRLHPLGHGRVRGTPVVRLYWEAFVERHRGDLRGRCLEIGSAATIGRGATVARAEVMDLTGRDGVDVVADLSRADHVASDTYDAFVVPFTAHLIYDIDAALHHAIRILKPGGVLLINFPCVDYYFPCGLDMGTGGPLFVHWWFTPLQVENLLRRRGLTGDDFEMRVDGNLFVRIAYQMNLPAEELTDEERSHHDPGHPLVIAVRIVKPAAWSAILPAYRDPWTPSVAPQAWNPRTGHYPDP